MQNSNYHHEETLDIDDQPARSIRFYGYLTGSVIIGALFWCTILLVPMLAQGMNPITVASQAIGYEQQIDHPMLLVSESHLRLIEPAAGPTSKD